MQEHQILSGIGTVNTPYRFKKKSISINFVMCFIPVSLPGMLLNTVNMKTITHIFLV